MLASGPDYSIIAIYMTEINTVVADTNDTTEITAFESEERDYTKITAVGSLATSAGIAYFLQQKGITEKMPLGIGEVVNSGCHPVLGFAGAWIGDLASRGRNRIAGMVAGATAANFFVETAQSRIIKSPQYFEYLANASLLETGKDYGAALGGLALYAILSSRDRPNTDS